MDNGELLKRLLRRGNKQRAKENASAKKEFARTERGLQELKPVRQVYEDRAKETITERNCAMLSTKYQEEQTQLEIKK